MWPLHGSALVRRETGGHFLCGGRRDLCRCPPVSASGLNWRPGDNYRIARGCIEAGEYHCWQVKLPVPDRARLGGGASGGPGMMRETRLAPIRAISCRTLYGLLRW